VVTATLIMANLNDIIGLFASALHKHQAGHLGGAEKLYRRILGLNPKHRDSLHLLGVIRFNEKKYKEAIALMERSLALGADVAPICFNLARAYEENSQLDAALNLFQRAQNCDAKDADIAFGIGTVLSSQQKYSDAVRAFDQALALSPNHADVFNNKGVALKNLGQFDAALAAYMSAITINPQHVEAILNRSTLLDSVLRYEEALEGYNHVLSFDPLNSAALYNCGKTLALMQRHEEAVAHFDKAHLTHPHGSEVLLALLAERGKICEWHGFEDNLIKLQRGMAKPEQLFQPIMVARLFDSPNLMLRAVQSFVADNANVQRQVLRARATSNRKIRVGYVSSDLHDSHPVYQALVGVLSQHDREKFDVHYFMLPQQNSQPTPERLARFGDTVHSLAGLEEGDMLKQLRAASLDIAIDLNGFTKFNRSGMFQAGIAPVQVNYLGSPGSMGSSAYDYIIGDATLLPKDNFANFAEKIVWLPNSFFPVDTKRPVTPSAPRRTEAGLPETGFVFGYFGMVDRLLPQVFVSWMRILKAVDNSVLWLKVGDGPARKNILREAERRDIAASRIIFAERTESNADHLSRLPLMDLCLDTLPYNAHMTALDCLFAGVPVLTLQGKSFAARVASSLLMACGLPELICDSRATYEQHAITLARTPEQLAALKQRLNQARAQAPLFDMALYTRNLECAYTTMVERAAAGHVPEHFVVT
jgi:protein O-GlcNAc transferase